MKNLPRNSRKFCLFIKADYRLKEISIKFGITLSAVNSHLFNIKKRLDLDGKCIQLKCIDTDIDEAISRLKFSSRSTKDFDIFMLILKGMTDLEICERLAMRYSALRRHRERLLIRNHCLNMQELISLFYNGSRQ